MLQFLRLGLVIVATSGVAGCSADGETGELAESVVCTTRWLGELPLRDPQLTLRGCLRPDLCSTDLTANLNANIGIDPSCGDDAPTACGGLAGPPNGRTDPVTIEASWQGTAPHPDSADRWLLLTITLAYDEGVASDLDPTDRPELLVHESDGETVIQSRGQASYTTTTVDGVTCRGSSLNLAGEPLP